MQKLAAVSECIFTFGGSRTIHNLKVSFSSRALIETGETSKTIKSNEEAGKPERIGVLEFFPKKDLSIYFSTMCEWKENQKECAFCLV
jgi:hypothetical protein